MSSQKTNKNTTHGKEQTPLLNGASINDPLEFCWNSESDRIKYVSKAYSEFSLADCFQRFYNLNIRKDIRSHANTLNTVEKFHFGNIYIGEVKSINAHEVVFTSRQIKDEVICKDDLSEIMPGIQNSLMVNNNQMYFELREKKNGKLYGSILNAYYKIWADKINKAIANKTPVKVHIDELTKGGYIAHIDIDNLTALTGKPYTHSVFIPGSLIVLNIERNFERWVGEDVEIIPQKFVDFRKSVVNGTQVVEKSLVGSRKMLLQMKGMQSMYEIYQEQQMCLAAMNSNSGSFKIFGGNILPKYTGVITGVISSNNKQGAFIELKDKYITGLMPVDPDDLPNYQPGMEIEVSVKEFETQEGRKPFVFDKPKGKGPGTLIKCNVRPVFQPA